jgi:hypothetical protein
VRRHLVTRARGIMQELAALAAASAMLTGCSYMKLAPVTYGGAASVASTRVADVQLVSGAVTGSTEWMLLLTEVCDPPGRPAPARPFTRA